MNQQTDSSRRTFIASAAAAAGVLAAAASPAVAADVPAAEGSAGGAPAFQGSESLRPLPFDPTKLSGLSERLVRSHWENNYGASVKALAVVKKRLAQAMDDKDVPAY